MGVSLRYLLGSLAALLLFGVAYAVSYPTPTMSSVIFAGSTSGTVTVSAPATAGTNTITIAGSGTLALVLTGTSASIGGSSLAAGACSSGTATVAGATTSMGISVTPATYPGAGFWWNGYVSGTNTVTVQVCAAVLGTPTASTYAVRVIQ